MSLKRFTLFTVSVFSIVMAVAIASANEDEQSFPIRKIVSSQNRDHGDLVLTAATVYPNTCFTPVRTKAVVDSDHQQIRLQHFVSRKNEICMQRLVGDYPTIELSPINAGVYTVVDATSGQILAEVETG